MPLLSVVSFADSLEERLYRTVKESAVRRRDAFRSTRGEDATPTVLLERATEEFTRIVVAEIAPRWYGTPWDFNGVSEVPGQGKIACGYFVTTVLRDAGVELDRVALAQAASESMIKALVQEADITRYSDVPVGVFEQAIRNLGRGLYLIGLDNHTGFIWVEERHVWFIHAGASGVIRQPLPDSPEMAQSRYRVVGRLSTVRFIRDRWLGESRLDEETTTASRTP